MKAEILREAAALANDVVREEFHPELHDWNPFQPDFDRNGLKIRDTDVIELGQPQYRERLEAIVGWAMTEAMTNRPHDWLAALINGEA